MSKNNKEKSSFWKKLGLGKHKASSASLSTAYDQQQPLPPPQQDTNLRNEARRSSHHSHKKQEEIEKAEIEAFPHVDIPKPSNELQHVNKDTVDKRNNDTLTPTEPTQNEQETRLRQTELEQEIDRLKQQLEKEAASMEDVRKQKEAIAKDLDYLGSTVDELYAEKSELMLQLEEEKHKNERQLEDLNVLMDKMKSNADNARDQSFAVDQYKLKYENYFQESQAEKKDWKKKAASKDKEIKRLNQDLDDSKEQIQSLNTVIEQLIQSHAAELSRITATAAAAAAAAAVVAERNTQSNYDMNTPSGSPQFQPKKEEELLCSPIPGNLPMPSTSSASSQHSVEEPPKFPKEDIDTQLRKLTKEKEKLESSYSRIPISGGGPQSRRRKEELEAMLDQVDSQLSKVKQRIKSSK
ncbi:hypothetical protein BY458DRAFT_476674 [Sporodiniella umbellata]|nr:hypothetical protein BY458DRAFT_476674 [Sporodiniella umbellata]